MYVFSLFYNIVLLVIIFLKIFFIVLELLFSYFFFFNYCLENKRRVNVFLKNLNNELHKNTSLLHYYNKCMKLQNIIVDTEISKK